MNRVGFAGRFRHQPAIMAQHHCRFASLAGERQSKPGMARAASPDSPQPKLRPRLGQAVFKSVGDPAIQAAIVPRKGLATRIASDK